MERIHADSPARRPNSQIFLRNLLPALFGNRKRVRRPKGQGYRAHFFEAVGVDGSEQKKAHLNITELSARSGLSTATIWRLKKDGKIPFFQPGGKGHKVCFPADAIERDAKHSPPSSSAGQGQARLSGPCPAWMHQPNTKHEEIE
jgi:predicted DNA-binding transcriptional regulator AlpA